MKYPVVLTADDNGTIMATFPDIPEAITFGADQAEALANASDALAAAIGGYIEDGRDIPEPSSSTGMTVEFSFSRTEH